MTPEAIEQIRQAEAELSGQVSQAEWELRRQIALNQIMGTETSVPHSVMVSQIDAAVLAERKRCAKVADQFPNPVAKKIAAKIRSGE